MVSLTSLVLAAAAAASSALAQQTIQILAIQDLSLDDTFVFKPSQIQANVGDMLEFHFMSTGFLPSNHSVAQGRFDRACSPMPGGFFSGYMPASPPDDANPNGLAGEAESVFQVQVTSQEPMAFYCTTGQHCTRGMYGVVNPNGSQNKDTYKNNVAVNGPAEAPLAVTGGQLVPNPGPVDQTTLNGGERSVKFSMAGLAGAIAVLAVMMA